MPKYLWVVTFVLLVGRNIAHCQQTDFSHYTPLQSSGTLPEEFSSRYMEKLARENAKKKSRKKDVRQQEQFLLQITYQLDRILKSGEVIYNDPITVYLNKVLKIVLEANGISDDIRVYLLQSAEVNAFAFDKNVILVTTGMMAQVSNEAELAYVLCHEYIHYRDKHVMTEYTENQKISQVDKRYEQLSQKDAKLLKSRYSKELETKADLKGLELFMNTDYSPGAASSLFEVFRYSELPFDEVPFDKNFLETNYLIFPDEYFLTEVSPVIIDEEADRKDALYSTHPNLDTRKAEVLSNIEDINVSGRKEFIVSRAEFVNCQKIARFEICRLQLLERDYGNALYSAYLLLKDDPENIYLKKIVARALYGLTVYANEKKLSTVLNSYKKVAGNSQRVFYLFDKCTRQEINYIALNYAWRLHKAFPEDKEVNAICDELFRQGVNKHELTPYFFKTQPKDTTQKTTTDTTQTNTGSTNKYDKIKTVKVVDGKSNKNNIKKENDFIVYGFIDLAQDEEFKQRLKKQWNERKEKEEQETDELEQKLTKGKTKKEPPLKKKEKIDKVIFLDPRHVRIDARKGRNHMEYTNSTDVSRMIGMIHQFSKNAKVDDVILERSKIGQEEAETLNDVSIIMDYLNERWEHKKITMLPTDQLRVQQLVEKYETPYVGIVGIVNYRYPAGAIKILVNVIGSIFVWPYLPYGIFRASQPDYVTLIYLEVYNMETNEVAFSEVQEYHVRDSQDVVNSTLYDMFLKLNPKKKKK